MRATSPRVVVARASLVAPIVVASIAGAPIVVGSIVVASIVGASIVVASIGSCAPAKRPATPAPPGAPKPGEPACPVCRGGSACIDGRCVPDACRGAPSLCDGPGADGVACELDVVGDAAALNVTFDDVESVIYRPFLRTADGTRFASGLVFPGTYDVGLVGGCCGGALGVGVVEPGVVVDGDIEVHPPVFRDVTFTPPDGADPGQPFLLFDDAGDLLELSPTAPSVVGVAPGTYRLFWRGTPLGPVVVDDASTDVALPLPPPRALPQIDVDVSAWPAGTTLGSVSFHRAGDALAHADESDVTVGVWDVDAVVEAGGQVATTVALARAFAVDGTPVTLRAPPPRPITLSFGDAALPPGVRLEVSLVPERDVVIHPSPTTAADGAATVDVAPGRYRVTLAFVRGDASGDVTVGGAVLGRRVDVPPDGDEAGDAVDVPLAIVPLVVRSPDAVVPVVDDLLLTADDGTVVEWTGFRPADGIAVPAGTYDGALFTAARTEKWDVLVRHDFAAGDDALITLALPQVAVAVTSSITHDGAPVDPDGALVLQGLPADDGVLFVRDEDSIDGVVPDGPQERVLPLSPQAPSVFLVPPGFYRVWWIPSDVEAAGAGAGIVPVVDCIDVPPP